MHLRKMWACVRVDMCGMGSGVWAGSGVTRWRGGSSGVCACVRGRGVYEVMMACAVAGKWQAVRCVCSGVGCVGGWTVGQQAGAMRCRVNGCVDVCVGVWWGLSTVLRRVL